MQIANDSSCLYKNFSQIEWHSDRSKKEEIVSVSMIELTTRIINLTSAMLLLFQFVFIDSFVSAHIDKYIDCIALLSERPGL